MEQVRYLQSAFVQNNTLFTRQAIAALLDLHGCPPSGTTDVVAIFDRHLRYVYLNEPGCRVLNVSPRDVLGHCIIEIYPHIIASANHRNLLKCLSGETINAIITGREGGHFATLYRPVHMNERIEGIFVRSWLT